MKRVNSDVVDSVRLFDKERLLAELDQEALIGLFKKSYRGQFKPFEPRKVALDQCVALNLSAAERDSFMDSLRVVKESCPSVSASSFIRSRSTCLVDVGLWQERALEGLGLLTSEDFDERRLLSRRASLRRQISCFGDFDGGLDDESAERVALLRFQLGEVDSRLGQVRRLQPKRPFRLSGRVSFSEANIIRWRASRLSLSVADYMRFLLFDYVPFSVHDRHLSVEARKRFYVSVIEVARNGWGEPPGVGGCADCVRLMDDVRVLREQLERFRVLGGSCEV